MKLIYQFLTLIILATFISCAGSRYYTSEDNYQNYSPQQGEISYQQFYDDLSPYGSWINYQNYGYVWRPNVSGFRPYYSNGHWVYTSYGWTWMSNYNWGWAPFHYGRWMNDRMYGWMWVPGYEWAPAWVSWRGGGDYYGWAPLGPQMGVNISIGSIPYDYWAFVPRRHINSPRINNYYVNQSRNVTIINNTTIINNNTTVVNNNNSRYRPAYNPGPSVKEVESVTRSRIRQFNVVEADKPGATQINNNSIRVYRPAVNQESKNAANTRPVRVINGSALEGDRQNESNDRNPNSGSTAPVRVFPKDQTPQINRNEQPANNNPVTRPQINNSDIRNNGNRRTFPNSTPPGTNSEQPANSNPVTRPQINNGDIRNNSNRRTFPNATPPKTNNEQPVNRPPAITNPGNNTNTRQSNSTNNRLLNRTQTEPAPKANSQRRELPARQPQQRVESQSNSGIRKFNPAQRVERQPQVKQENKE